MMINEEINNNTKFDMQQIAVTVTCDLDLVFVWWCDNLQRICLTSKFNHCVQCCIVSFFHINMIHSLNMTVEQNKIIMQHSAKIIHKKIWWQLCSINKFASKIALSTTNTMTKSPKTWNNFYVKIFGDTAHVARILTLCLLLSKYMDVALVFAFAATFCHGCTLFLWLF